MDLFLTFPAIFLRTLVTLLEGVQRLAYQYFEVGELFYGPERDFLIHVWHFRHKIEQLVLRKIAPRVNVQCLLDIVFTSQRHTYPHLRFAI